MRYFISFAISINWPCDTLKQQLKLGLQRKGGSSIFPMIYVVQKYLLFCLEQIIDNSSEPKF